MIIVLSSQWGNHLDAQHLVFTHCCCSYTPYTKAETPVALGNPIFQQAALAMLFSNLWYQLSIYLEQNKTSLFSAGKDHLLLVSVVASVNSSCIKTFFKLSCCLLLKYTIDKSDVPLKKKKAVQTVCSQAYRKIISC